MVFTNKSVTLSYFTYKPYKLYLLLAADHRMHIFGAIKFERYQNLELWYCKP